MIDVTEEQDLDSLFSPGNTTALTQTISGLDDFELIAFLAIVEAPAGGSGMNGRCCTGGRRQRSSVVSFRRPSSTSTARSPPPCARSSSPTCSASRGPTSSPTRRSISAATAAVPEIQVFVVDAKGDDVSPTRARCHRQGRPASRSSSRSTERRRGAANDTDGRRPQAGWRCRSPAQLPTSPPTGCPPTPREHRCRLLSTCPASTLRSSTPLLPVARTSR